MSKDFEQFVLSSLTPQSRIMSNFINSLSDSTRDRLRDSMHDSGSDSGGGGVGTISLRRIKDIREKYIAIENNVTIVSKKKKILGGARGQSREAVRGGDREKGVGDIVYGLSHMYHHQKEKFLRLTKNLPKFTFLETHIIHQNLPEVANWINHYGLELSDKLKSYYLSELVPLGSDFSVSLQLENIYQRFTSVDIQADIEKNIKNTEDFVISSNHQQVHLKVALNNSSIDPVFNKRLGCLGLLMLTLQKQQEAHVAIVLSQVRKKLNWNYSYHLRKKDDLPSSIGPREVNTGSSWVGHCNGIFLWRTEEIEKVLCHEMGHCLGMDTYPVPEDFIQQCRHRFCVPLDTDIRPCETWVEMWSLVVNLAVNGHLISEKNSCTTSETEKITNLLYQWEKRWHFFQIAKILVYFGFEKVEDFYSIKGFDPDDPNRFKFNQQTSVISYFILKSALWSNLEGWLKWCHNHPDPFKLRSAYWGGYQQLVWKCLDAEWMENINRMIPVVKQCLKAGRCNRELNCFRMTCVEIDV